MCQQKGFKLRFVCAKKHTTARVEKKNVSVSLLGKKRIPPFCFLVSLTLAVFIFEMPESLCIFHAKMGNVAKCYLEYTYDILHWRTPTYNGKLTL